MAATATHPTKSITTDFQKYKVICKQMLFKYSNFFFHPFSRYILTFIWKVFLTLSAFVEVFYRNTFECTDEIVMQKGNR
jgi:hypothetical protein